MTGKYFKNACIYGAGAIGGWIGAGLAASGCNVSVVARGATLAALQTHGLRLQRGQTITSHAVKASANPANLGVQDLVVIAVKAPALLDVVFCTTTSGAMTGSTTPPARVMEADSIKAAVPAKTYLCIANSHKLHLPLDVTVCCGFGQFLRVRCN